MMNWFEKALLAAKPVKQEQVTIRGRTYLVHYIEAAVMERASSFGCAYRSTIFIRVGLPERVRRFVVQHEAYHITDQHHWLGWFGSELRANTVCGVRNPIGLLATIRASLTAPRLKAYGRALVKRGWWK
jgi:hypothetical protein